MVLESNSTSSGSTAMERCRLAHMFKITDSILSFGSSSLFDNFSLVRTTSMKREFVKVPSLQVSF